MDELEELREWALEQYKAVSISDYNIHKFVLKATWQQIIKKIDEMLLNY